jgi:hypothetical protein
MRTYTKEQAVKRNVEMLDAAVSKPSLTLEGDANNMKNIFRSMFLADESNNKQGRTESNIY